MLIKFIYQIFSVLNAFLHDSIERFLRTKIQKFWKTNIFKDNLFPKKISLWILDCCIGVDVSCNSLSRLRSSHSVNVSSISNLMGNKFEKWSCFGLAESYQPAPLPSAPLHQMNYFDSWLSSTFWEQTKSYSTFQLIESIVSNCL